MGASPHLHGHDGVWPRAVAGDSNLVALAGFILLVATLEVHVRRVEEPYLLRTHSAVYRGYTASVGRFVPGVGLIR